MADLRGAEGPWPTPWACVAAAHRRATDADDAGEGRGEHVDERVARAGLARLSEPGDPRLPAAVAALGAVAVFQASSPGEGPDALRWPHGPRLSRHRTPAAGPRPRGRPRRRTGWDPLCGPRRRRVAAPARRPDRLRGGAGAGRRAARALGRVARAPRRSVGAVVGSRSSTTYGEDVAARSRRAGPGGPRRSPARRSGSTRRPTGGPGGRWSVPSPCWPAASTAPTRRRTAACSTTLRRRRCRQRAAPGLCADTAPLPRAQRLIAALTRGTVLWWTRPCRSGALNTANWARPLSVRRASPGRSPARLARRAPPPPDGSVSW